MLAFSNSLLGSALSISILELQKHYSVESFGNDQYFNSLLAAQTDALSIPLSILISYILTVFRKTNRRSSKLLIFPITESILALSLQWVASYVNIGHIGYLIWHCFVVLFGKIWMDSLITEIIITRSSNKTKSFLNMSGASFGSNVLGVLFALLLTEHQMCYSYILAPITLLVKIGAMIVIIVSDGKTKDAVDQPEASRLCEQEPDTRNTPIIYINALLALVIWGLYWSQRGEYVYTYRLAMDKLKMSTASFRIMRNLQYIGFSISTTLIGRFSNKDSGLFNYGVLIFALSSSVFARILQTVSWFTKSVEFLFASTAVSIMCPFAGSILKVDCIKRFNNSPWATTAMTISYYLTSLMCTAIYYLLYVNNIAPFLITSISISICLFATVVRFWYKFC